MPTSPEETARTVTRRTVVKGAAWSAPVIAVAAMIPGAAASAPTFNVAVAATCVANASPIWDGRVLTITITAGILPEGSTFTLKNNRTGWPMRAGDIIVSNDYAFTYTQIDASTLLLTTLIDINFTITIGIRNSVFLDDGVYGPHPAPISLTVNTPDGNTADNFAQYTYNLFTRSNGVALENCQGGSALTPTAP